MNHPYDSAEKQLNGAYVQAKRTGTYLRLLEDVAAKHHAARSLSKALQNAQDAVLNDLQLINLRDWAYDIERNFEFLYKNVQNALDYRQIYQIERLNRLIFIFFPLMIIASLFGTGLFDLLVDIVPISDPLVLTAAILLVAFLIDAGFRLLNPAPRRRAPRQSRERKKAARIRPKPERVNSVQTPEHQLIFSKSAAVYSPTAKGVDVANYTFR
ncbi:hypothetical protein KFU94_14565 [Chloroflexi bacterium TSY]|nr:hypothetical protein [Chloroflexi bacterium TSY]